MPPKNVEQTEGQQAAARIAEFRQNVNNGATPQEARATVRQLASGPTATPVITPASLQKATAPTVTPTPIPTAQTKLQADLDVQMEDALSKKIASEKLSTETAKTSALDAYIQQLSQQSTKSALESQFYESGGVNAIQNELDIAQDKMRKEKQALNYATQVISERGGGLQSGAQAEISNLERISLMNQANLAVIEQGIQQKFDSAKAIADRTVDAIYDQQTKAVEVAKFDYLENKEAFTTAEQREYDLLFKDRENRIATEKENKKSIYDLGLQAQLDGAPVSVVEQMLKAKTKEEAMAIGGGYIGRLDRLQKEAAITASRLSAEKSRIEIQDAKDKQAQIQAAIDSGQLILSKDQQDTAYKLGKDFEAESKEFKTRAEALNTIVASSQEPTAAGDLALIFAYMKMLDPNSVVREQEFANAQNAAGIPERVRAQYNNALKGERLTENTRTDFVDRATDIYNSSLDQQMQLEERYRDKTVNLFGLPEEAAKLVVQDIRSTGAVSDVVFGVQLNNASDEQLLELQRSGLIPTQ